MRATLQLKCAVEHRGLKLFLKEHSYFYQPAFSQNNTSWDIHTKYEYLFVTNLNIHNWEFSYRNQFTPLWSSLINNWPKYFPTLRSASDYSKEANVVTEFSGLNSKIGRLTYILHVKIAWSRSTRFNLKFPVLNSKFWPFAHWTKSKKSEKPKFQSSKSKMLHLFFKINYFHSKTKKDQTLRVFFCIPN